MNEKEQLIATLEAYQEQNTMSVDVGYHLRQLIKALQEEEDEENQ